MRAFGWLCLVMVIGFGCIAGTARADEDEGAREIRRAIEEIEAEIVRIEATVKQMQARAALQRQLADVTRRRVELEKKAGLKRITYTTGELDPFGKRVEARKKAQRRELKVANEVVEGLYVTNFTAEKDNVLKLGEPEYVVVKDGFKKGKSGKSKIKKKDSLEARVARLEAENKKLHAIVNALMHRNAHATSMPAGAALQPFPPRPPTMRAPVARKAVTSNKKSKGGIDARLDRIEHLLMQLLHGKRASAGVMRAPAPPAPPMRIDVRRPAPVRVGKKVFEVKEAKPTVFTYGVKTEPGKSAPVVEFRKDNFDVVKRYRPGQAPELLYTKKAPAKGKAGADGVKAQIKLLEKLLKQAEERMREIEKSLGK